MNRRKSDPSWRLAMSPCGLLAAVVFTAIGWMQDVGAEETTPVVVGAESAAPTVAATEPISGPVAEEITDQHLPFVYTDWQHFTTSDGLPNDHVFAIKADGHRVWVSVMSRVCLIYTKPRH